MEEINLYFKLLFALSGRGKKVKDVLSSFCNLEGYAITEYEMCFFSPEWQDYYGLEYFGEEKVLFDFHAPAVDEDRQIIISYQEFYEIVSKYYGEYANQHPEEKDEIIRLLAELRKKLNVSI